MSKTIKEERLRWIKPIADKKIKLVDVSKVCPYSRRSLERWLSNYRRYGTKGLEPQSTRPKSCFQETSIRIKERTIELRNKEGCCAKKLSWKLEKEGIKIHPRTIGKIIKKEGLTKKYRTRRIKYRYLRAEFRPGELVEIDVKYVPKRLRNRRYYQYTAIDCASRWRYMKIYDEQSTYHSMDFLKKVTRLFPEKIKAIKTDNHSIFTNRYTGYLQSKDSINPRLHPLDLLCKKLNIKHYLIDPGKPAQNGKVERSHRSDQEHFYDQVSFNSIKMLRYKIRLWNMYYNNLEHCGLDGRTPNEALHSLIT